MNRSSIGSLGICTCRDSGGARRAPALTQIKGEAHIRNGVSDGLGDPFPIAGVPGSGPTGTAATRDRRSGRAYRRARVKFA